MKIPDSISAMVYDMRHPALWTIMMWVVAMLGIVGMLPVNEQWAWVAFLACSCIIFVGAIPLIKEERNTLHNILGISAGVISQLWIVLCNISSPSAISSLVSWWIVYVVLLPVMGRKWCLWVELWCMVSVILYILCNNYE